jgi:hypothetical protein
MFKADVPAIAIRACTKRHNAATAATKKCRPDSMPGHFPRAAIERIALPDSTEIDPNARMAKRNPAVYSDRDELSTYTFSRGSKNSNSRQSRTALLETPALGERPGSYIECAL